MKSSPVPEDPEPHSDSSLFGADLSLDRWVEHLREELAEPELGTLGGYRLVSEVGRGAQGVVYRAVQPGTERDVALKLLAGGSHSSDASRRRFAREVEAAATLDHPGVVTIHGLEIVDGRPVLVMAWVDGLPLDRWVEETEPDTNARVELFLKLADALHDAHLHGVLHRDVKPSNVLVDAEGRPRLVDFGLALLEDAEERLTRTTAAGFVGTLAYASPEQLAERRHLDARSDQYSLAVLFYELLAGRRPFHEVEGLAALARATAERRPPPLSGATARATTARATTAARGSARELDAVLAKALGAEPAERYDSVAAFADDVRRWRDGLPVRAHPPGTAYLVRKWARRNPVPATMGALLAVALVAFAVVVAVKNRAIERQRASAVAGWTAEETARERAEDLRTREEQARREAEDLARSEREAREEAEHLRGEAERETTRADAAREDAERESDRSKRLFDYLANTLLLSADPMASPGLGVQPAHDITVVEVLDTASRTLDEAFPDEPLARADLRDALARTYLGLGRIDEHIEQLKLQIAAERDAGSPAPEVAFALTKLAAILGDQGRFAEADDALAEAEGLIAGLEESPPVTGARVSVLRTRSVLALGQGRMEEGERLAREAVAGAERLGFTWKYDTLSTLEQALALSDKHEEAAELDLVLIDMLGEDNPRSSLHMISRANSLRDAGRLEEASLELARAEELAVASFPRGHHILGRLFAEQAENGLERWTTSRTGDLEEVKAAARRSLENVEGLSHLAARPWTILGQCEQLTGDPSAAASAYARGLEIWEHHLGADHPQTAMARMALASALRDSGRLEESREQARAAVGLAEAVLAQTPPDGPAMIRLAPWLEMVGKAFAYLDEPERERAYFERLDAVRGR